MDLEETIPQCRLFTDAARTGSRHGCDGFGTGFCPCLTPPSSLRHQPSHAIVLRSVFPLRLGGEKKVSFGVRTNCWSCHRWHSASSTHGAASGAASPSRRQRDPLGPWWIPCLSLVATRHFSLLTPTTLHLFQVAPARSTCVEMPPPVLCTPRACCASPMPSPPSGHLTTPR